MIKFKEKKVRIKYAKILISYNNLTLVKLNKDNYLLTYFFKYFIF